MFSHVYFTNSFFSQLKKMHQDIWTGLGQPQWKIHFGDDSFQDAMKYIRKRKFTELNDNILEGIYKKMKNVERIALGLGLLIFLATLLDIFTQG